MSKIAKPSNKKKKVEEIKRNDEQFAYKTVIISAILGGIFYVISIFANMGILSMIIGKNPIFNIIEIVVQVFVVLLFFLFMLTSMGNYKELTGKPLDWKEILLLFGFSIGQTLLNLWTFFFTILGLILILIYTYLVQES
ncbi:MAG: hypothetical protein ACFFB0_17050 [Promethearchaeota archaeon]